MGLFNSASIMHVMRKFTAAIMAVSLLLVSTVPAVSAVACEMPGDMQETGAAVERMQTETVTPIIDWQDCYIECGCRVDNHLDGMPHQLAPHVLSMGAASSVSFSSFGIIDIMPALTSWLLPFSPPPPRTI